MTQADRPSPPPPHEPVRRTSEIEEISNVLLIHPISSALTPVLARLGVSPNAVSLTGMGCGIAAGFAYFHASQPIFACAGFVLMLAWHVLDGADGQLARLTNTQSPMGKVLDGICDYVTFIAVYTGLALSLRRTEGDWVVPLAMLSGACHAVQSAAYELQRQDYEFFGRGKASAELTQAGTATDGTAADRLHRAYEAVQRRVAGLDAASRRRLTLAIRNEPDRARYRAIFAPRVRRWSVLSANMHTLAIFVFAVAGRPVFYFWFEILGLTAVLAWLTSGQRSLYADFIARLDAPAVAQPRQ